MRLRPLVLLAAFAFSACSKSSESAAPTEPASAPPAATSPPPPPSAVASSAPKEATTSERQVDVLSTSLGDVRIIPIHHGSVLFELGDKAYYVDPFREGNFDGLPKADFIFITHAHPDHFDTAAIETLRKAS